MSRNEIRLLQGEDALAFQTLRLRGLQECPEAFSSSYAEEVDTPQQVVAQRLPSGPTSAVYGCFAAGEICGLIGIYREARHKLSHKASIWGMYVAPENRQQGIGRSLVEAALDYASREMRVHIVTLGVNTQNTAALSLYEATGFRVYGTERGFLMLNGILHDQHLMARVVRHDI